MTDMSQRIQMEGNTFFQIGVETLPEEGKSYVIQKSDKAKAAVKLVEGSGGGEPGPQGPQGPAGPAGAAATVTVGDVTTLDAGQDATVTNAGTTSAAVFNFGIPKGPKGDKGDPGAQGPAGEGVPTGGTAGQILAKVDATDYNTQWIAAPTTPTANQLMSGTAPAVADIDSGTVTDVATLITFLNAILAQLRTRGVIA